MAAVTSLGETPLAAPATRGPQGMQRSRRRRLNAFRYVVFTLFGLFIVLPLLALARFSLEGSKLGTWSVAAVRADSITIGSCGVRVLSSAHTSKPFLPGRTMSSTTMSKRSAVHNVVASSPLTAVETR